jgi:hypothetical protein
MKMKSILIYFSRTFNVISGNFRNVFYFYAWGDPANLRNRQVGACEKRWMTIYVDFIRSATGGLSPEKQPSPQTNQLNILNAYLAKRKRT